jgi:hypothetical protein
MEKNSTNFFTIIIILWIFEDFYSNASSRNKFSCIDNADTSAATQVL